MKSIAVLICALLLTSCGQDAPTPEQVAAEEQKKALETGERVGKKAVEGVRLDVLTQRVTRLEAEVAQLQGQQETRGVKALEARLQALESLSATKAAAELETVPAVKAAPALKEQ